ncbi:MAG TPA: ABC transporter permease [Thermomicrobiaceae bacterium]|nr:ABC transporter permease [Thermomicrobiaceae bacterium]
MTAYIIRRVLLLVPIWFGILILVFLMRVLVPGDPIQLMFAGQITSPQVEAELRHKYGLDKPLPVQFIDYVDGVVHGNLGTSITTQRPVLQDIESRYPYTLVLALTSLGIAVVIGVVTGILSAVYKDSIVDALSMVFALAGLSMPAFWLGLLLIYFFAVNLGWFPVLGSMTPKGIVLPSVTLGVIASAIIARLVRSCMLDVLGEDYIRTARAKGIGEKTVILRHALRNALLPIITIIGLQFGGLLSGAFIIEVVFAWHGVGELAVQALQQRDFPLIQGIVLVVATTYVLVNLVVDLLYAVLDPRITYS